MKTLAVLFITLLFSTPFVNEVKGTETKGTDIVIAENLIDAINNIDITSMNVLLAEGANVDTVDRNGNTPLMLASKIGNPRMVKIILAHNPDINAKNTEGNSALMIASEYGQYHIANELINKGADVYARNNRGLNSLEIATRNGHPPIINLLKGKSDLPMTR